MLQPGQSQGLRPSPLRSDPAGAPAFEASAPLSRNRHSLKGATTITKILAALRSILKSLTTKAKISVSVALSVPGFLKVEVSYARDLAEPRKDKDA